MGQLEDRLPAPLRENYTVASVMGDRPRCQTLLLRGTDGSMAVLKQVSGGTLDEKVYEAVRSLEGDGVPRMLGLYPGEGRYEGELFLLREYVEGQTLLELCRQQGPMSRPEAAEAGVQVCRTLKRLHGMDPPLIHRDIKAENVVRTPEGRCVLIDFDIARFYDQGGDRDTQVLGTGFAAAPEQFGYAQTDPRSDLYSLGVMLHELATGEFSLSNGKVPGALGRVIAKCTRFDPADRYQSAAALEKALSRISHKSHKSRQPKPDAHGHTRKTGRKAAAAVTAVLAVLLVLVLGLGLVLVQTGILPKDPPKPTDRYRFASPAIGQEVARQLGKDVEDITWEDLGQITSLLLIGQVPFQDWYQLRMSGDSVSLSGLVEEGMEHGTIDTLEDIPAFPNLTALAVCNQEISDLSPLRGCPLQYLSVHGNTVSDISPLQEAYQLKELDISLNPVSDLTPLEGSAALYRLSMGMTEAETLLSLKSIPHLSQLNMYRCSHLESLDGLEELTGLNSLFVCMDSPEELWRIARLSGLEALFLWSQGAVEDLTELSALEHLQQLYLDIPNLGSLEGLEALKCLTYLDFRGNAEHPLDAAPVAELTELEELTAFYMRSGTGWSEVSGLAKLRQAVIRPSEEAAFRAALPGGDVTITFTPP